MKTTWKTLAVVLLVVGGGIGFVSLKGSSKPSVQAAVVMTDTTMVSMQSDMHSCENCTGGDHSQCVLGSCTLGDAGMAMTLNEGSCQQCSSGDHSQCIKDRCTPNEPAMAMSASPSMAMNGMVKPAMSESEMSETKMANAMTPSMTDIKMTDKEMAPKMDSGSMVGTKMQ